MKKKNMVPEPEINALKMAARYWLGGLMIFVKQNFPKKEAIAFLVQARKFLLWKITELRTEKQETTCTNKK